MDPDKKTFEPVPEEGFAGGDPRQGWPKFHVGQEVEISGIAFRIRKITPKDLVLRPKR